VIFVAKIIYPLSWEWFSLDSIGTKLFEGGKMPNPEVELQEVLKQARREITRLTTESKSGSESGFTNQNPDSIIAQLAPLLSTQLDAIELIAELLQAR
jgi:hypothetical protein